MNSKNWNIKEIIVIPDVHGRSFWRKVLEDTTDRPIVFLGDYLDPYLYEFNTDFEFDHKTNIDKVLLDTIQNFKDIIEFKKQNPDRITLLTGNHDLHYCGIAEDTCRMDVKHLQDIFNLFNNNKKLFEVAYIWNNTLFTHAGVTTGWLEQSNLLNVVNNVNVALILNNLLHSVKWSLPIIGWQGCKEYIQSPLTDIGRSRGGYAPYGGPTWADIDEMWCGAAFDGKLTQIVGHSQQKTTGSYLHNNNVYCCDSRSVFTWDGKTLKKWE